MAVMDIRFYSEILDRTVSFKAIIPGDNRVDEKKANPKEFSRNIKTLYLLHGKEGDSSDYLYRTDILTIAMKYNLAVIMPSGENSWYVDKEQYSSRFKEFIGKELVEYVQSTFHLSKAKNDNFIGGLSMGGYGAICTGLTYYNTFSKIVGLSSALIIDDISSEKPLRGAEDLHDFEYIFDSLENLKKSDKNPEVIIRNNELLNMESPKIFLCIGKDDFLYNCNQRFVKFLKGTNIDFIYKESEGIHNWDFWNEWLEPSIKWLLEIDE
jgi:S-formylglutathione hydrolase FrmB